MKDTFKKLSQYARLIETTGLSLYPCTGAISIRDGNVMQITRKNANFLNLNETDILSIEIQNTQNDDVNDSEIKWHGRIYLNTDTKSIVHIHTPYAIIMSFLEKEITPIDTKGLTITQKIHIVSTIDEAIETLKVSKMVIIKKDSIFSVGDTIDDAYRTAKICEGICQLKYLTTLSGVGIRYSVPEI